MFIHQDRSSNAIIEYKQKDLATAAPDKFNSFIGIDSGVAIDNIEKSNDIN